MIRSSWLFDGACRVHRVGVAAALSSQPFFAALLRDVGAPLPGLHAWQLTIDGAHQVVVLSSTTEGHPEWSSRARARFERAPFRVIPVVDVDTRVRELVRLGGVEVPRPWLGDVHAEAAVRDPDGHLWGLRTAHETSSPHHGSESEVLARVLRAGRDTQVAADPLPLPPDWEDDEERDQEGPADSPILVRSGRVAGACVDVVASVRARAAETAWREVQHLRYATGMEGLWFARGPAVVLVAVRPVDGACTRLVVRWFADGQAPRPWSGPLRAPRAPSPDEWLVSVPWPPGTTVVEVGGHAPWRQAQLRVSGDPDAVLDALDGWWTPVLRVRAVDHVAAAGVVGDVHMSAAVGRDGEGWAWTRPVVG